MKRINALIDGILFDLHVTETALEYREGARASGDYLGENQGYMFEYEFPQSLSFENTGVPFELKVLYVKEIDGTVPRQGVVMEEGLLFKDSSRIAFSRQHHKLAIEIRKDSCDKNKIGLGSIVTLINIEESTDE